MKKFQLALITVAITITSLISGCSMGPGVKLDVFAFTNNKVGEKITIPAQFSINSIDGEILIGPLSTDTGGEIILEIRKFVIKFYEIKGYKTPDDFKMNLSGKGLFRIEGIYIKKE